MSTGHFGSERGAILVQTAVASLVLVGFMSFVLDYGVYWVSRSQAQNTADSAALAGAISRAYDDFSDPPPMEGPVGMSATRLTETNLVWTAAGAPIISFACPPDVAGGQCVRVAVYRNGEFGSTALPWFFGPILGAVGTHGVVASATAQVRIGNVTNCLRPWAIPDRWVEGRPPVDEFDKYVPAGGGAVLTPQDTYTPPDAVGPGTGWQWPADIGTGITLTFEDPFGGTPINTGDLFPLQLPGVNDYAQNIASCNGQSVAVGDLVPLSVAATAAMTDTGMSNLIASDPGATWNAGLKHIDGSCAPACAAVSPRLVAIALYDVDQYQLNLATGDWSACPGGTPCVRIVNMLGFFLDATVGVAAVSGYLTAYPGLVSTTAPTVSTQSSFLKAVTLVR